MDETNPYFRFNIYHRVQVLNVDNEVTHRGVIVGSGMRLVYDARHNRECVSGWLVQIDEDFYAPGSSLQVRILYVDDDRLMPEPQ